MENISLEDALLNHSLTRGEIEIKELDKIYRGPIKEIFTKGDDVYFHLLWCANYDICTKKWTVVKHEIVAIFKKSTTTVTLAPNGNLILKAPEIIVGSFFLEGESRLDPAEVEGLDLNNLPGPQFLEMDV